LRCILKIHVDTISSLRARHTRAMKAMALSLALSTVNSHTIMINSNIVDQRTCK